MITFLDLTDDIKYLLFEKYFSKDDAFNMILAYPELLIFYDRECSNGLSFDKFDYVREKKVKEYVSSIKGYRIELSHNYMIKRLLTFWKENNDAKLMNLKLSFIQSDASFIGQLSGWTNLQYLCLNIVDVAVNKNIVNCTFINSLVNLKYLDLTFQCQITDLRLSNLNKLKYFSYYNYHHKSLTSPFLTLNSNHLKYIKIFSTSEESMITDNEIVHISTFPLKSLDFSYKLSQVMINAISTMTTLKCLNIYESSNYDEQDDHDECEEQDDYVEPVSKDFSSLSNLIHIIELRLYITKTPLSQINIIIERMNNLQNLYLHSYIKNITVPLIIRNPNLTNLHIAIADGAVIEGLEHTQIKYLRSIGSIHPSFLNNRLPYLEKISMFYLGEQNYDSMNTANAPSLRSLKMYGEFNLGNGVGFINGLTKDTKVKFESVMIPRKQFLRLVRNAILNDVKIYIRSFMGQNMFDE